MSSRNSRYAWILVNRLLQPQPPDADSAGTVWWVPLIDWLFDLSFKPKLGQHVVLTVRLFWSIKEIPYLYCDIRPARTFSTISWSDSSLRECSKCDPDVERFVELSPSVLVSSFFTVEKLMRVSSLLNNETLGVEASRSLKKRWRNILDGGVAHDVKI